MPDLQSELEKLNLPTHFDDEPVTEPEKPMNKTSAQIVYDIVAKYPNLTRNDIRKHAIQHGVPGATAVSYISQFARSEVFGRKIGPSGFMTYHTLSEYRPPLSGVRKQKAKSVKVDAPMPIGTINIDELKLCEARALYEQLKAIFESK
jgi:hypothetical protein